jgi:tellurite resistance protein
MELSFVDADTPDFDPQTYIRILVAIAKANRENGPPEFAFVRRQAQRLGLDFEHFLKTTEKDYFIDKQKISRLTALVVLKDAIELACLDGNFSLPEKQLVYDYAAKLDVARKDVDALETLLNDYRRLDKRWRELVSLS